MQAEALEVDGKEADELQGLLQHVRGPHPAFSPDRGETRVRFTSKTVLLTYPALHPEDATLKSVEEFLRTKFKNINELMVAKEKHTNPTNPQRPDHFHVFISMLTRFDTHSYTYFDMTSLKDGRTLFARAHFDNPWLSHNCRI